MNLYDFTSLIPNVWSKSINLSAAEKNSLVQEILTFCRPVVEQRNIPQRLYSSLAVNDNIVWITRNQDLKQSDQMVYDNVTKKIKTFSRYLTDDSIGEICSKYVEILKVFQQVSEARLAFFSKKPTPLWWNILPSLYILAVLTAPIFEIKIEAKHYFTAACAAFTILMYNWVPRDESEELLSKNDLAVTDQGRKITPLNTNYDFFIPSTKDNKQIRLSNLVYTTYLKAKDYLQSDKLSLPEVA